MREKIVDLILRHGDGRIGVVAGRTVENYTEPREVVDQILALIREEIEKLETPDFYEDWGGESGRQGYEACREDILKALGDDV